MSESVIDFDSVVPGTTVRAVKIDSVYYMPRRDIIMAVCNTNDRKRISNIWTSELSPEEKEEVSRGSRTHQFDGQGQSVTDVLNMDNAILLTMMLPGKFARSVRIKAANLLKKWIHDNTDDPLLREMAAEPVSVLGKHKREDLEFEERRLVIHEREARLQTELITLKEREAMIPVTVKERELANHQLLLQAVQSMCPGNVLDDRSRLMFKDRVMNLMMGAGNGLSITNGPNPDGNPKSVSDIVSTTGKIFKPKAMIKIGTISAAKYRERYGDEAEPPKHPQWINGRSCPVNHYVEKDYDLVELAIQELGTHPGF
jgi:hypothetical protein